MKRLTWKNDNYPASEKQLAFISTMLEDIKRKMATSSLVERSNKMQNAVCEFWNTAAVPVNLTSTEASGLIDSLKLISRNGPDGNVEMYAVVSIAKKLAKNEKVNSQTPDIMLNVFTNAFAPIETALKELGKL